MPSQHLLRNQQSHNTSSLEAAPGALFTSPWPSGLLLGCRDASTVAPLYIQWMPSTCAPFIPPLTLLFLLPFITRQQGLTSSCTLPSWPHEYGILFLLFFFFCTMIQLQQGKTHIILASCLGVGMLSRKVRVFELQAKKGTEPNPSLD